MNTTPQSHPHSSRQTPAAEFEGSSHRRSRVANFGRFLGAGAAAAALFAAVPTAAHADSSVNVGVCVTILTVTTCPPTTPTPPRS